MEQSPAIIVENARRQRVELGGTAKIFECCIHRAFRQLNAPQPLVRAGIVRIERDGLPQFAFRLGEIPLDGPIRAAERSVGLRARGIERERLPDFCHDALQVGTGALVKATGLARPLCLVLPHIGERRMGAGKIRFECQRTIEQVLGAVITR